MRLISPVPRLFPQPFMQAQIKENIEATCHWPLCGEFNGDRWILRARGQQRGKCFHLMTSVLICIPFLFNSYKIFHKIYTPFLYGTMAWLSYHSYRVSGIYPTYWTLGDGTLICLVWFQTQLHRLLAWALAVYLISGECQSAPQLRCQHYFR